MDAEILHLLARIERCEQALGAEESNEKRRRNLVSGKRESPDVEDDLKDTVSRDKPLFSRLGDLETKVNFLYNEDPRLAQLRDKFGEVQDW
jgi:hypothetical protein